ncbi:MAG TPA: 6-phosphogluconolactonase [Polyangia bacterium]|nr:6-phosphogluconolactonase [Polyangia bacterium]
MSPPAGPRLIVAAHLDDLVARAATHLRAAAAAAIEAHGRFRIALAGGSTPRALYPALVTGVDWTRATIFFGDERAVGPDDPQSNYRMARETLLDPAGVPAASVVRWRGEAPDLDAAARDYERALTANAAAPWLDLALLGLGADGHTASLFPGTSALTEESRLAVAVDVPVHSTRRLTLTYPALCGASEICFLVTGRDKASALAAVLGRSVGDLPATRIMRAPNPVTVFCDTEAAGALSAEARRPLEASAHGGPGPGAAP